MKKFVFLFIFLSFSSNIIGKTLRIIAYSPSGVTESVRETTTITVTFNEPMIALKKLGKKIISGPIKLTPSVKGKYKWLGTKTLAFYPNKPLKKNTLYKVKVLKNIKSINGHKLKKEFVWKFETVRPRLIRSVPYNNSKWVDISSIIYLYFHSQ